MVYGFSVYLTDARADADSGGVLLGFWALG